MKVIKCLYETPRASAVFNKPHTEDKLNVDIVKMLI